MKAVTAFIITAVLALASNAMSSDVDDLRWDQSNIQTLRSYDKAAVVNLANEASGNTVAPMTENELWEYKWADLAGDGKYELVTTTSSGPCCVFLGIYWQRRPGTIELEIVGRHAGKLSKSIRDLNGDGKDELIIWKEIAQPGSWSPQISTPMWPAVYRLEHGKYVEASRDFPEFYDKEILPQFQQQLKASAACGGRADVAGELEKDKILRVLGRDPNAGLETAYQWMATDDPQRIQGAIAIFRDLGGHKANLRATQEKLGRAIDREIAAPRGD